MREEFGKTLKQIRKNKSMTAKALCHDILTPQQLSNIEKGNQMPSTEKFIMLLDNLNMNYDEFIFLINDDYLMSKAFIEKKLAEYVKRQNISGLIELAEEASNLFNKHHNVFYEHVSLMAYAMAKLFQTNHDYQSAAENLHPITEYLSKINEFTFYEISLVGQCLFMFDIETALSFGEKALTSLEKRYSLYKNKADSCVLLTNMAVYCLDHENYYHLALKYAQLSINYAATSNDATRALHAKIIKEVACFKLKNGLFDKKHLFHLINTFKLLTWKNEYQQLTKFIQKHGISTNL